MGDAKTEAQTVVQAEPQSADTPADVDVYCGIVLASAWPLGVTLAVEVEVPKGSHVVSNVSTNVPLPGLRRYLRRLRGLPIGDLMYVRFDDYHAGNGSGSVDLMYWVKVALGNAVIEFKRDGDRLLDWLESLRQG